MSAVERARRIERLLHGGGGVPGRLLRAGLAPAELLYRLGSSVYHGLYDRGRRTPQRVAVPVISVGNIAVGGAGKTPFAAWLVDRLQERDRTPALLHGGYGFDEPALHRRWHPEIPVVALKDRLAGAGAAITAGADVIVLDDGFQHRRLHRDLDIVLFAAESWTPQPRLLPRGPWREPLGALERADIVVVTRKIESEEGAAAVAAELARGLPNVPIVRAAILPDGWEGSTRSEAAPRGPTLAVAGIAAPETFLGNAAVAGASVESMLLFPDHHDYSSADVARIRDVAEGRPIVTTAKDAVKLRAFGLDRSLWVLRQRVTFDFGLGQLLRLIDLAIESEAER